MASIGITWHMDEKAHALAEDISAGGGCLRIGVDERCLYYPNLDIYMLDRGRARLAAAAINGDLADELQALRDALANPPAFYEEADWRAWLDDLIAGVDDTLRRSEPEAPKPAKVTA